MTAVQKPRIRCAIYTRKSTEEGLDMEYNTLDAQRDAAEAYILSQRHEGWTLVVDHYDDGGFSGGNMERPALKRLMEDIKKGLINVVVVYKIDRLTRSLMDFSQLVSAFDQHNVSFVSVTQQFNTTTSMGRLTLNILLSFAQFEREVTGERIRDKVAASKRKGMWMGGHPPLGYDVKDRHLHINKEEAEITKHIFSRFITLKSMSTLTRELRERGIRTKTFLTQKGEQRHGTLVSPGYIYRVLNNAVYVGDMPHKDKVYPGQHDAIISRDIWNEVHAILKVSPRVRGNASRRKQPAILRGLAACGGCQSVMSACGTRKKGKVYSYYAGSKHLSLKCADCPLGRVPAAELERVVFEQIKPLVQSPSMVAQAWLAMKNLGEPISQADVTEALQNLELLWSELFPEEQRRILELLLERVDVFTERVDIKFKTDGLGRMVQELLAYKKRQTEAA